MKVHSCNYYSKGSDLDVFRSGFGSPKAKLAQPPPLSGSQFEAGQFNRYNKLRHNNENLLKTGE